MHGFQAQKQFRHRHLIGKQSTAVTLTSIAVCLSLCLTSGCAMSRKAWSGLQNATCGEPDSQCRCHCGKDISDVHIAHDAGEPVVPDDCSRAASQSHAATPSPPAGRRPIDHEYRPQAATMNGMPGTWTPSPPFANSEFEDQSPAYLNNPGAGWPEAEVPTNLESMKYFPPMAQQTQRPPLQAQSMFIPGEAPDNDDLKECRTQFQILAEQLSQMKTTQESMKASQATLQQSHEREMLELKLQQTTADRDRLQREHDLEQQLEKQRQRELDSIDSLSEIINGVIPAPAIPNAAPGRVPRATTQSGQVRSMPSQNLPTVDESL